jgi:hypothetical protein
MHTPNQSHWQHSHDFVGDLGAAEKNKAPLKEHEELVHVTVEIHPCGGDVR